MIKNPINNNTLPQNPSAYTFNINLSLQNVYTIDLSSDLQNNAISKNIQSCWIDNSNNSDILNVNVSFTQQNIVVPALSQGMYPLIIPHMSGKISISSNNTNPIMITIILLDVPIDFVSYNTTAFTNDVVISGVNTTQALNVAPSNTSAAPLYVDITNTVPTTPSNTSATPLFTNPITSTQQISAVSLTSTNIINTAYNIIPAQAAGYYVSVSNILINIAQNTIMSAAGLETLKFYNTAGVFLFGINVYLPAAISSAPFPNLTVPGFLISTATDGLSIEIPVALAGGNIDIIAAYNVIA